jgi:hypothetical protein
MLLHISQQTPLFPQTSSETKHNNLVDASINANTLRNFQHRQQLHVKKERTEEL